MPKDVLLDDDFDLMIVDGDFVVNESTAQHQKILIFSEKGEFKEVPMRGIGARRYLEDHAPDNFAREMRTEFTTDGMKVNKIQIAADLSIQIDASYYQ